MAVFDSNRWAAKWHQHHWVVKEPGKNPTDRGKLGAQIHLLVDERGALLAIYIIGTSGCEKWSMKDSAIYMVVKCPNSRQHFLAIRAMITKIQQFMKEQQRYQSYSKLIGNRMNRGLRITQFQTKPVFQHDVGR
jgi:hypothetical protein